MQHIHGFFSPSKQKKRTNSKKNQNRPRLERSNAAKNIEYDASSSSSFDSSISPSPFPSVQARSLELSDRTSFRVEGVEGDFDLIFRSMGVSLEDFDIPPADWEAHKGRTSLGLLSRSKLYQPDSPNSRRREKDRETEGSEGAVTELCCKVLDNVSIGNCARLTRSELSETSVNSGASGVGSWGGGRRGVGGGIKGVRPPLLKRTPSMSTGPVIHNGCSTSDPLRDFAPDDESVFSLIVHDGNGSSDEDEQDHSEKAHSDVEQPTEKEEEQIFEGHKVGLVDNGALSESYFSSNDDDASSSSTEPPSYISPNGRSRRIITNWQKGEPLGRGSFGSVYAGISENGFFFAVKEVSLLDQGTQGRQSVYQLEQEIALLSQFEHENIVQYLGTDKDGSNLYIFLELVTMGSLQSLYGKYELRETQVSAYTRQILHGLKYLHDRKVVHRDIKCANILVDANGSVKLADFGLAKATTKLNDVKSCKGTASWMAPEVVKGQGYGIPADIWSLGCTVLEMLTQKFPYSELEPMQALFKIGKGVPPSVPEDLSSDAKDFILQCIQVNPHHRPTAADLLNHPFVKRPLSTSSDSASILQCIQVNPRHRPTAGDFLNHPFVKRPLSTSSGSASPYHPGRRS